MYNGTGITRTENKSSAVENKQNTGRSNRGLIIKPPEICRTGTGRGVFVSPRIIISVTLFLVAFFTVIFLIERSLSEKMPAVARIAAERKVNEAVNLSVAEFFSDKDDSWSKLVVIGQDSNGAIRSLSADTVRINALCAALPGLISEKLTEDPSVDVTVPIGSLIGLDLFSGRGKKITLSVYPAGSVIGDTESVFESCGINQVRHSLYAKFSVFVTVFLPGSETDMEFSGKVLLSESVIFGEIPEVYVRK